MNRKRSIIGFNDCVRNLGTRDNEICAHHAIGVLLSNIRVMIMGVKKLHIGRALGFRLSQASEPDAVGLVPSCKSLRYRSR